MNLDTILFISVPHGKLLPGMRLRNYEARYGFMGLESWFVYKFLFLYDQTWVCEHLFGGLAVLLILVSWLSFLYSSYSPTIGHCSNILGLKYYILVTSNSIYRLIFSKLKTSASHSRLAYWNVYLTSSWVLGRHLKFIRSNPWFPGSHVFSISGNTTAMCQLESPSTLTLSLSLPSANPA